MNPDPDYSAAYVELITDSDARLTGSGFVFTIGRGNDVEVAAIKAVAPMILGKDADALLSDMGAMWRSLVYDSPLRWLGPEKGVMHMAIGAIVNALWDLKCKLAGLPLWRLLAQMTPEELVDLVDFRYLTDALTRDEALAILPGWTRWAGAPRGGPAQRRLSGVHDYTWLARLRRRQARAAVPRSGRRRIHSDQAQGRCQHRRRHQEARDREGRGRAKHRHCHRREPALGCRRRGQVDR